MPSAGNVKLNDLPAPSAPESNAPTLLVTVWPVVSLFVQVTVVPTGTVIGFGAYPAAPFVCAPWGIETVLPDVLGLGVGDVGDAGVAELPLPHPVIIARAPARRTNRQTDMQPPRPGHRATPVHLPRLGIATALPTTIGGLDA